MRGKTNEFIFYYSSYNDFICGRRFYTVIKNREVKQMGKQAEIEVYTPLEYYNDLFKKCIKESRYISPKFYYLITNNKLLQEHIDQAVIDEFLLDDRNIEWYIEEVFWGMPNISKNFIDVDNDNIIYDTISKIYNIQFVYGGDKTLCFATRK